MKTPSAIGYSLILSAILGSSVYADPWNKNNDPARFSPSYNYKFSTNPAQAPGSLPLKAVLSNENMPWSSSYWPRNKGSINYQWNTERPDGFELNLSNPRYMSRDELARLSPAQKFDLAQGRYDYPLANAVKKGSKKTAKDVEGICDGWTASAIQFQEPKPIDFKNPQGQIIPFGSSDLKALMSYDVSLNQPDGGLGSVLIGGYCGGGLGMKLRSADCIDINPGAFHVILANEIGLRQRSFAADIDPLHETWNQPVYGFEFEVTGSASPESDKAAKAYHIHAKMMYGEDDPADASQKKKVFHWNPAIGTDNFTGTTLELDYILELDWSDRIVGGKWDDGSLYKHPDIFWKPTKAIQFTEEFNLLNQLVTRRPNSGI
jgi:hypothetical protein